ncbi:hypothetical protein HYQ46_008808 [Verticillium longisporum]|nr:hypothetical protein HYQ46_008808 [Verticillium longisporum]
MPSSFCACSSCCSNVCVLRTLLVQLDAHLAAGQNGELLDKALGEKVLVHLLPGDLLLLAEEARLEEGQDDSPDDTSHDEVARAEAAEEPLLRKRAAGVCAILATTAITRLAVLLLLLSLLRLLVLLALLRALFAARLLRRILVPMLAQLLGRLLSLRPACFTASSWPCSRSSLAVSYSASRLAILLMTRRNLPISTMVMSPGFRSASISPSSLGAPVTRMLSRLCAKSSRIHCGNLSFLPNSASTVISSSVRYVHPSGRGQSLRSFSS